MRCWLQISSGRGPEECCWVVAQLARYILQQALNEKFEAEILEKIPGQHQDALRSVLLALEGGERLFEFVAGWKGIFQWIGKSPYRPTHRRKNWFVSVAVFNPIEVKNVQLKEIKIETMRSSGPGGQHTNKTESAVRVTDRKTGLSIVSQEERSQFLNKKLAIARLQKLLENQEMNNQKHFEKMCWEQHNSITRGDAVQVFVGNSFKLKK